MSLANPTADFPMSPRTVFLPGALGSSSKAPTAFVNDLTWGDSAAGWSGTIGNAFCLTGSASSGQETTRGLRLQNFGFAIPLGATILGFALSITATSGNRTSIETLLQLVCNGTRQGINKADGLPLAGTIRVYGGTNDLWGVDPTVLTPLVVNDPSFGLEFGAVNTGISPGGDNPTVQIVQLTVFYRADLPFTTVAPGVLYDTPFANKGWSDGAGIVLPIPSFGAIDGSILGYSLKFVGRHISTTAYGLNHGKLGRLYSGLVSGPEAAFQSGWRTIPKDTTLLTKLWDGDTDALFPFDNPAAVVPDVRIANIMLPQPIEIDRELRLAIGLWLSPSLGPASLLSDPNPGVGTEIVSCTYSLLLQGESVTPVL